MSRKLAMLLGACGAALAVASVTPAHAVPIASGSVFNIFGNVTGLTATQITFANPADSNGNTGSFASFGNCKGCATMTSPLTYSPFTAGQIYTATNNGITTTFTIDAQISAPVFSEIDGAKSVSILDTGTATLTGYDPTPGKWIFTANQFGQLTGSFSSTTLAVPEPASLTLLGVGLVGLGMTRLRRRRRDAASA